ncbi:MAG: leucyl aminopeptidase family protein [Alphaproteobacteria bacterium]|nr:leucyl aminopeptidase family protein [Alphaproteobacteria bacterium]
MPAKLPFLDRAPTGSVPIRVVAPAGVERLRARLPAAQQSWLAATGFRADSGTHALLPAADGRIEAVLFCLASDAEPWVWAALAEALPQGAYRVDGELSPARANPALIAWALAGYAFTRYGKADKPVAELAWPKGADRALVEASVNATALVRDLINTPAEDMGPSELAAVAQAVAKAGGAKAHVISGDKLLAAGYPAIHAVGRAADDPPRLIELIWGEADHPLVALVGKGVCFDSGGLDLKTAAGMKTMKKDMGGAAHVLGLAQMIMATALPVRLKLLIPAVENSVAGNAYRPMDVVRTRKGLTVEIGNTDAEGRVILSDCLFEASRAKPEILLDFATLTGAARVALGTSLPALFSNDDRLASALLKSGKSQNDPLWRMPLHQPYRSMIDSKVADLNNAPEGGYAGAITAALFLERFVATGTAWAHIDLMAWNERGKPGRPEGGEAMGLRAAYAMLAERFTRRRGGSKSAKRK